MLTDESRDDSAFISFGLVLSLKKGDVDHVRCWLEENGVKIIFQTWGPGPLFVLREYQVRRILQGDTSQLRQIYEQKILPAWKRALLEFRGLPKQ